jgi:hypothetical protein
MKYNINILTPLLYVIIPYTQRNQFSKKRLLAALLVYIGCVQYHYKPDKSSIRWNIDQIIMWTCGPYMLTYDYRPSVLVATTMSGMFYFFYFKEKSTELEHSMCIHLPIALAMYLQKPLKK